MTDMTKTERALDRAWKAAAKHSQHETLANLRLAFEALWPIDLKLTPRAVERLEDCYPDATAPGGFTVLGRSRIVFHDASDADDAAERLEETEDEAVTFALGNVQTDLTQAQEDLLERSVRASIQAAARKLRRAARLAEERAGLVA